MKSLRLQTVIQFHKAMQNAMPEAKTYLQECPSRIFFPLKEVRELRAKLIFEECIETIKAMGVDMTVNQESILSKAKLGDIQFAAKYEPDIIEVADGLADIDVVVGGTYAVFGMDDAEIFNEIHKSNMSKFPEGYDGLREDGKWIKPPSWKKPVLRPILELQGLPSNYIAPAA